MATGYPGITVPVSLKESTVTEEQYSVKLIAYLNQLSTYENENDLAKRNQVLGILEKTVVDWVIDISRNKLKQRSSETESCFGTRLLPFGGQAIGVVTKGGDIDALCVVPNFVTREEFFRDMPGLLLQNHGVTCLRKVEAAYVPVIQFKCQDINIDMSLAILRYEKIAADLVYTNDRELTSMDVISIRSISGIRDAKLLLSLVPNKENFISTLKCVKLWAKSNGLHNSAMGYTGGIAWAIMVARVCQMYPLATVSVLLHKFFVIVSQWRWPQPVLLKEVEQLQIKGCLQWNPKMHPGDGHHVMPVITPAYPEHNSAFTVGKSSRDVINKQITQAALICEQIFAGNETLDSLFKPIDFFHLYKHFLMVTAISTSEQGNLNWSGFIESQVRKLVEKLETQNSIQHLHLYTRTYTKREKYTSSWFIGLKLSKTESDSLDLTTPMAEFADNVKAVGQERKLWQEGMKIEVKHIPRKQIEKYLSEMDQT